MRLLLASLLLLVAPASGCGDDSQADDGATSDAQPPRPVPGGCNPSTQAGCTEDEKCGGVRETDKEVLSSFACVPDGSALAGAPCERRPSGETGYDDCVAGFECIDGTCQALCEVGSTADCRGFGVRCDPVEGFPDEEFGLCAGDR